MARNPSKRSNPAHEAAPTPGPAIKIRMYRHGLGTRATGAFFAAVADLSGSGEPDREIQDEVDSNLPFDKRFVRHLRGNNASSTIAAGSFFDRQYFGPSADPNQPDQSWRRWRLDGGSGRVRSSTGQRDEQHQPRARDRVRGEQEVLLFVANAQVGNWLSWANLSWDFKDAPTVTGDDLLKRVVFYKVGHHGSHNATLKAKGLELMRSDEFVASIPVNHKMALKKRWGKMPLPKLVDAPPLPAPC